MSNLQSTSRKSNVASESVSTVKGHTSANPVVSKWSSLDTSKLQDTGVDLHYVEPEVWEGVAISRITKEDVKSELDFWSTSIYCHILGANPPFAIVNGYLHRI